MLHLICYDIVSPKRRRKAAQIILDFGGRVQKSAFECDLKSDARRRDLLKRLRAVLDPGQDTLRLYRVCAACREEIVLVGVDKAPPPTPATLIL